MMTEEIVGCQFDGFFGCDEQNVDGGAAVHAKVALSAICFPEAVEPEIDAYFVVDFNFLIKDLQVIS